MARLTATPSISTRFPDSIPTTVKEYRHSATPIQAHLLLLAWRARQRLMTAETPAAETTVFTPAPILSMFPYCVVSHVFFGVANRLKAIANPIAFNTKVTLYRSPT